jgi:hypothetical protein
MIYFCPAQLCLISGFKDLKEIIIHLTRLSLSGSDLETVGDHEDGSAGQTDVLRPQRSEFDELGPASLSQQLYGLVHAAALNISSSLRIRILLSSCKNSKKNLDTYYFVTLFDFLSL